ncbi:CBO0543 family protein [Mesobacillus sp.]|uniref:CBO0543 family protein n=1 Tax=Mesobacillus sp. TaxID=2675271 RepID=UPI0039EDEDCB
MVLFLYLLMNGIAIIFFMRKKKELHILEILAYWFFASYVAQNFSALFYMNFKNLYIPEKLSFEFSHFISRITLYPLLMVLFLDYYLKANNLVRKLLLMLGFVVLLTSIEWLNHFLGVLVHKNWQFWWSPAIWFAGLLLLIGFMKIFRILLFRGGEYK